MNTYKNVEIAEEFNISKAAVTRWIENAQDGKNNLQLTRLNNKVQVIRNEHNRAILKKLSEGGAIFKNKSDYAEIFASQHFYGSFTQKEIIEIINNLTDKKEIPVKFSYISDGAIIWENLSNKAIDNGVSAAFNVTPQLLNNSFDTILGRLEPNQKVNLVELGPGNCVNSKEFIKKFQDSGKLNKYIAIDISDEMLRIAQRNVNLWFPEIATETHKLDFESYTFPEILYKHKTPDIVNVLVMVGNTFGNVQDELRLLKNIEYSIYGEDIFVFINKLEKYNNLADFEHIANNHERHIMIPKWLGIDTDSCEFVLKFDESIRSRVTGLKLDKDYKINILDTKIMLYKGDEIQLWRYKMTVKEELIAKMNQSNLEILNYNTDKKMSHFLMICKSM